MKTVIVHRINWNMGYAPMPPLKRVQATHSAGQGGLPPKERLSCDRVASMAGEGYPWRDKDSADERCQPKGKGWNKVHWIAG